MSCNCKGNTYQIGMGCCQPVLGPIENYYTKSQIDEIVEQIEESGCCITEEEVDEKISAATSGLQETLVAGDNISISGNVISAEVPSLSGYATEQWVENKGYLTEHQPLKTINNQVISGTGNIVISSDTDLSDYYTKGEVNSLITDMATKTWVRNQNYASYSEMIQYIENLQNQINSLIEIISGCCGSSGETIYRWLTMTSDNDYTCSGTTKMTKEKQQSSNDNGVTWSDTGQYRTGSTVLEENCIDCGYEPSSGNVKFYGEYTMNKTKTIECDGNPILTFGEIQYDAPSISTLTSATIGGCSEYIDANAFAPADNLKSVVMEEGVDSLMTNAFSYSVHLESVVIPNSVTFIGDYSFSGCTSLSALTIGSGVTVIDAYAFYNCSGLTNDIVLPNITRVNEAAFYNCKKLHSVTLGSGCTRIENGAFRYCSGLTSVTVEATTPPTLGSNVFADTTCSINVPSGSVDAYKTTYPWRLLADRIQAIP